MGIYVERDIGGVLRSNQTRVMHGKDASRMRFDLVKYDGYFLSLGGRKVGEVLEDFSRLDSWNPRGKFVVVAENEEVVEVVKVGVANRLVDYVVVREDPGGVLLYTWDVHRGFCEGEVVVLPIGDCETAEKVFGGNSKGLQWGECNIKILAMPISPYVFRTSGGFGGLEVRFLDAIRGKMGFNFTFLTHSYRTWGLLRSDGNYSDMFGRLQGKQVDIVMGMCPTNYTHMWDFEMSNSYLQDALVWLVPKALEEEDWRRLQKVFPNTIWLIVLVIILAMPVVWSCTSYYLRHNELNSFRSYKNTLIKTMSVFFNVSVQKYPRTSTLRWLFILYAFYSLILTTIYQSKLISTLTQTDYSHQISTVDELLESGLNFGGNINIKTLFNNSASKTEQTIYQNLKICDLTLSCPNRTAFLRDFATIKSEIPSKFLIHQYYTKPDGSPMIYILQTKVFFHYVNIFFSKSHPIFPEFNSHLVRLVEGGFGAKWLKDLEESMKNQPKAATTTIILNLEIMLPPFLALTAGLVISFVVFSAEILYYKLVQMIQ